MKVKVYSEKHRFWGGDELIEPEKGFDTLVIDGSDYSGMDGRLYVKADNIVVVNSKLWAAGGVFLLAKNTLKIANTAVNILLMSAEKVIISRHNKIGSILNSVEDAEAAQAQKVPVVSDADFSAWELSAIVDYKTLLSDNSPAASSAVPPIDQEIANAHDDASAHLAPAPAPLADDSMKEGGASAELPPELS